ncbi:hypothetical protein [Corynebacterium timonense]|uniref:hypothetical protein n=1 Tax=Corynebacterium timonense TaxID=441500 RepID=UPI0012DDE033|nr:hypothetical protein [Corynebacterium timonense]
MSALTALGLGVGLATVPYAEADSATTTVNLPLACNLQLKDPSGLAQQAEGVYNSAESAYSAFKISAKVTAPATVKANEEFDYTIDLGQVSFPASFKASVATATVNKVSQLNLWVDLPSNATIESVETSGGSPAVAVKREGNRLHFTGQSGADVTTWSKGNRAQFAHGGLEAQKVGNSYVVNVPKVTLKMRASATAGETIQPRINAADAATFSPDSFVQLYTDATAKAFFINLNVSAFIRCGLSQHDTHYPSKGGTNRPADPLPAVKVLAADPVPPAPTASPTTTTSAQPEPTTTTSAQPEPTTTTSVQPEPTPPVSSSDLKQLLMNIFASILQFFRALFNIPGSSAPALKGSSF